MSAPMSASRRARPSRSTRPTTATPSSPTSRWRRAMPTASVEATADVVILRPADPTHGNGTLLLDVPNRGRKLAPQLFDDSAAARRQQRREGRGRRHRLPAPPGLYDGLGRLAGRHSLEAGTAGAERRRCSRASPDRRAKNSSSTTPPSPARATLTWPAADPANLAVTVRAAWADPRQTPPGLSARLVDPTTVEITRPDGFDAGALYEITYTARDPVPLGMGYAACATSSASCATTQPGQSAARRAAPVGDAARSVSASRNPAASCATSSISASTRTPRAAWCSTD